MDMDEDIYNQGASTSKDNNKNDDDDHEERNREERERNREERERNREERERADKDNRSERSYSLVTASSRASVSSLLVVMRKVPHGYRSERNKAIGKRDTKEQRKRVKRGRVVKRRRSPPRRNQVERRVPRKSRLEKKMRLLLNQSNSSVFTMSSRDTTPPNDQPRCCKHCGHHVYGRRWQVRQLVEEIVKKLRRFRQAERKKKQSGVKAASATSGSEAVQAGSRSKILSPLFIDTNAIIDDDPFHDNSKDENYTKITPSMIFETVKKLTMWQELVPFEPILDYVKMYYPANPDPEELTKEVSDKLKAAVIAGIICQVNKDGVPYWRLSCDLLDRGLDDNYVTAFWNCYFFGEILTPAGKMKSTKKSTNKRKQQRCSKRVTQRGVKNKPVDERKRIGRRQKRRFNP